MMSGANVSPPPSLPLSPGAHHAEETNCRQHEESAVYTSKSLQTIRALISNKSEHPDKNKRTRSPLLECWVRKTVGEDSLVSDNEPLQRR